MRIAYIGLPVLLAGCVSSGSYLGNWEHKDNQSFVRVGLESGGKCSIFLGGKAGDVFEGIGGNCRYSEEGAAISITDIADVQGSRLPEKLPTPIGLKYEADTDTLVLTGERTVRLARAATK
jgi:hypothetical protein